eukprot:770253-Prymnesium_polylepis.1
MAFRARSTSASGRIGPAVGDPRGSGLCTIRRWYQTQDDPCRKRRHVLCTCEPAPPPRQSGLPLEGDEPPLAALDTPGGCTDSERTVRRID